MELILTNTGDNYKKIDSISVPAIDIQIDYSREKLLTILLLTKPLIIFPKHSDYDDLNSADSALLLYSPKDLENEDFVNDINNTLYVREEYYKENENSMVSDDFIMQNVGLKSLDDIKRIAPAIGINREDIVNFSYKSIQENWMVLKIFLNDGTIYEIDINILFPNSRRKRKLDITNPLDLNIAKEIKIKILGGLFQNKD